MLDSDSKYSAASRDCLSNSAQGSTDVRRMQYKENQPVRCNNTIVLVFLSGCASPQADDMLIRTTLIA